MAQFIFRARVSLRAWLAVSLLAMSFGCKKPVGEGHRGDIVPKDLSKMKPQVLAAEDPPVEFANSIGMRFRHIKPASFWMGSPEHEKERNDDEAQHPVRLTKAFYLGVFEVTQDEYLKVMKPRVNPSWFSSSGIYAKRVQGQDTSRYPVEGISWDDAKEFCAKLTSLPDEKKAGRAYRLPTEAEWEYACRGPTPSKDVSPYHVGKTLQDTDANFGKEEVDTTTKPVGSYKANAFGLFDMHGNVWEWCEDLYGPYDDTDSVDPKGAKFGRERVMRGGSWWTHVWTCRTAYRGRGLQYDREIRNTGVRVVCVPLP